MTKKCIVAINILMIIIISILSYSGRIHSTPESSHAIQKLINPSIRSGCWKWGDETPIKPVFDSQDDMIYTIALKGVHRKAIILRKQDKYTYALNNPGSGTLEFWGAAFKKNSDELFSGIPIKITFKDRKKLISKTFSIISIDSPDHPWTKFEMPVTKLSGQVECTLECVTDGVQAISEESYVFIGTPVFIPDNITSPPNVVLVSFDSLRADELGAYGSSLANSPTIDMLSKQGIVFSQSLSTSSWTSPAVKNLFAGYLTQMEQSEGDPLTADSGFTGKTIQELYAEAGYYTSAVIANPLITADLGFERGFDAFDTFAAKLHLKGSTKILYERIDNMSNDLQNKPFFLYIHFMDPHDPYNPDYPFNLMNATPAEDDIRKKIGIRSSGILNLEPYKSELLPLTELECHYLRNHYRNEIREVDSFFHSTLISLHRYNQFPKNTVIIVIADHGEEFNEHGYYQHGMSLYEAGVRVPWIMSFSPSLPVRHIEPGWVSTMDIPPTLSRLTIDKWLPSWKGVCVYPKSSDYPTDRQIFTVVRSNDDDSIPRERWRAVYQREKKLVWTPSALKAYDLDKNPEERPLFRFPTFEKLENSNWEAEWKTLGKELEDLVGKIVQEEKHKMPHALMMQLKELGYVN